MKIHINKVRNISGIHVSMNLNFVQKLCRAASRSSNPAREFAFIKKLGIKWNEKVRRCTTVNGWLNGYRTVPMSKLNILVKLSGYGWAEVEKNIIKLKAGQRGGEIRSNFPILLDERIGSVVGHILGDGSISARFTQVFFSNKNPELLKEFIHYMREIFGAEPRIWEHSTNIYGQTKWNRRLLSLDEKNPEMCVGLFYPAVCGIILHGIFGDFAFGKKKHITSKIHDMRREFKKGLLRALFDDEASCSASSYYARMHQDNKRMLEDLRMILREFNVDSNPVRFYEKRGKTRCYFNITGRKNFVNFSENIGFTSSKKQEELNKLVIPSVQRCRETPRLLQ